MIKSIYLFSLLVVISFSAISQEVYQHVSDRNIYEFVDELANDGIVEINSVVKPYSRMFIASTLSEAEKDQEKLNKRQQKELDFYLLEYKLELDSFPDYNRKFDIFGKNKNLATSINPLAISYKDKLFSIAAKPIWGTNYFIKENESIYHRWGGFETFAYIGEHWGFYASLRDNNESKRISGPRYFTQRPGGAYKYTEGGGGDYSEMRGGVTYSWKWGSFGLVKDHNEWGNNYHGPMIMTDRAPSYAQIKLRINPAKWFEFNYYHGWLVSMVVDSVRSDYSTDPPREVFRPKYIVANMFTFIPWKRLNISIGNSIIYSDMGVQPAYLIPIMFYKSIDHTMNQGIDNQNSQMFLDISSRNIKNVHLYGTFYFDELKIDRITDSENFNFWSTKVGVKTTNLLVQNLSVNIEYSMSMPINYQHRVSTLTYASNDYNMGYYLRDNSQEIYISLGYKPVRGLHLTASYMLAQHGPDYDYTLDGTVTTHSFMEEVKWQNQTTSFKATYEFINNAYLFFEYMIMDTQGDIDIYQPADVVYNYLDIYTPEFFRGKNNIISVGFNIGF